MTEENWPLAPHQLAKQRALALNNPAPTKQRPEDQVLPTPNQYPSVHAQVAADLMERERIGVSRYGTPLQPFNGRDADQDLYEELLDAAAYMKQRMIEKAAEGPAVFPTFMQAWEWMRSTAGFHESTPLQYAPQMTWSARKATEDSPEGRTMFEAAAKMLRDAGVLP